MKLTKIVFLGAVSLASIGLSSAAAVFTLTNTGDLDGEADGATITNASGSDTVVLTTVDIIVPNIVEDPAGVFTVIGVVNASVDEKAGRSRVDRDGARRGRSFPGLGRE